MKGRTVRLGIIHRIGETKFARMLVPAGIEPESPKKNDETQEPDLIDISKLKKADR